ncbi:hypothetical protein LTR56_006184 [Elasticomyces elasticus]|nr:hypothetical protein LTR56_006184 [Elasticomyces elasticus]KAK4928260.1 hypothetical protein LTR49_004937 [Elasticomyces elasticus]KAK5763823.1 hypothetical protein LTS12_005941 [Elasticomyces elasticus]
MQYSINMKANELQQYIEQLIGVDASDRRKWEVTTEDFGVTSESRATAIKALERSLAIVPNGGHINAAYWGLIGSRQKAPTLKTAVDPTVASSEADSSASGSMVSEVSHMSYDQHVTDIVTTRDGHCLVCLDRANVQAVHIFPASVSESHDSKAQTDRPRFLQMVSEWFGFAFCCSVTSATEGVVNTKAEMEMTVTKQARYEQRRIATMVTLCAKCRDAWTNGAYALKPISVTSDKCRMRLMFLWQPAVSRKASTPITVTRPRDPCPADNSFLEDNTSAWSCQKIMRYDTNPPALRFTGDIIEVKTIDPVTIPLPDADLMLLA